jgi:lauroyl/myristoyl acyltransferase
MTQIAAPPSQERAACKPARLAPIPGRGAPESLSDRARTWLTRLMLVSERSPRTAWIIRRFFLDASWYTSPELRTGTLANAAQILGPDSSARARRRLARAVNANFYDFLVELAAAKCRGHARPVAEVIGAEHLAAALARGRGVLMATAHLGSFESGIEGLRTVAPRVHVVFRRWDDLPDFERLRQYHRRRLGVSEIAIEDGLEAWDKARRALEAGEIVLMQADRVMPGQRGAPVPFLDGHVLAPLGPVKMARMTGAPIVPVFAPRCGRSGRRVRIIIEAPIDPPASPDEDRAALEQLMALVARRVVETPEQWLMLHAAWLEDQGEVIADG